MYMPGCLLLPSRLLVLVWNEVSDLVCVFAAAMAAKQHARAAKRAAKQQTAAKQAREHALQQDRDLEALSGKMVLSWHQVH